MCFFIGAITADPETQPTPDATPTEPAQAAEPDSPEDDDDGFYEQTVQLEVWADNDGNKVDPPALLP